MCKVVEGFSDQTASTCAVADSFLMVMVMEADATSFYQQKNLIRRVNSAAEELNENTSLRGIIINKALDSEENGFRARLQETLPIAPGQIHVVPLDPDAARAYKGQEMPRYDRTDSQFSYFLINAFTVIMSVVTAQWSNERVEKRESLRVEIDRARMKRLLGERVRSGLRLVMAGLFAATVVSLGYIAYIDSLAREELAQTDEAVHRTEELQGAVAMAGRDLQSGTARLAEKESTLQDITRRETELASQIATLSAVLDDNTEANRKSIALETELKRVRGQANKLSHQ